VSHVLCQRTCNGKTEFTFPRNHQHIGCIDDHYSLVHGPVSVVLFKGGFSQYSSVPPRKMLIRHPIRPQRRLTIISTPHDNSSSFVSHLLWPFQWHERFRQVYTCTLKILYTNFPFEHLVGFLESSIFDLRTRIDKEKMRVLLPDQIYPYLPPFAGVSRHEVPVESILLIQSSFNGWTKYGTV